MKVVIDTNVIFSDFNMESPAFTILFKGALKGNIEICIPEVVRDEVFNKYRQQLESAKTKLEKELETFNKLAYTELQFAIETDKIDTACRLYEERFERLVSEGKLRVIPYPEPKHHKLAKKAILAKKPFNSNEKGYRDALIWENILSLISDEEKEIVPLLEVIFITTNKNDFLDEKGNLHGDLIEELEVEGLKTDSINVLQSIQDFNQSFSKLFFEPIKKFRDKLQNDEFWNFKLKDIVDEHLFAELPGEELPNWEDLNIPANSAPTIETIDDGYKFDRIDVKKLSVDEYVIDVYFKLGMDVDFFVDKTYNRKEEKSDYYVLDFDWNDHVIHGGKTIDRPMFVTLIINSGFECLSIEINDFEGDSEYY